MVEIEKFIDFYFWYQDTQLLNTLTPFGTRVLNTHILLDIIEIPTSFTGFFHMLLEFSSAVYFNRTSSCHIFVSQAIPTNMPMPDIGSSLSGTL